MRSQWIHFLNRYGILAESCSLFGLALVLMIFLSRDMGLLAIILSIVFFCISLFLLLVYFSNARARTS